MSLGLGFGYGRKVLFTKSKVRARRKVIFREARTRARGRKVMFSKSRVRAKTEGNVCLGLGLGAEK